jgi:hypothetical protein
MKTYTMAEMVDQHVGVIGTKERDKFELKLKKDILKRKIKVLQKSKI